MTVQRTLLTLLTLVSIFAAVGFGQNTTNTTARVTPVEVGEICSSNSMCLDSNAECRYDGSNSATYRCLCRYGYVFAQDAPAPWYTCAAILSQDAQCLKCEANGGVCYNATGMIPFVSAGAQDYGCACPSFRSGYNCNRSHADVSCNATAFTMVVCYKEHDQYTFGGGGAFVVAEGKGISPSCRAVNVTNAHSSCPVGQHQLVLPLVESKREKCGTKRLLSEMNTIKYQTTIVVQHSLIEMQPDDVSFVASCSYDTHADGKFQPIGVSVANAAERGQHHQPTLVFSVQNHLGMPIPDGVAIRLGDGVRFGIKLIDDGTYAAIRVSRCLASSTATLNDLNAVTLPLVLHSCPSPDQIHISVGNNWQSVSGKYNELRTGLVRMFKMSQGRSLHIHCTVQLCLKGSELDCRPVSCIPGSLVVPLLLRSKRSAPTTYTISKTISWYEDSELHSPSKAVVVVMSSKMFAVILGIIGVALMSLMVIVTSLIWRKRQHQTKATTPSSSRP